MNLAFLAGMMAMQGPAAIDLRVDATDGPRNILRVVETVPTGPGSIELRYPKWIPGNHRPSGPINEVVNFHVYAGDQELKWRRDPVEMNDIHVDVPAGAEEVVLKFVVAEAPGEGWSTTLGRLRWNRVVFLPVGDIRVQQVRPHLTSPAGWTIQGTLRVESRSGQTENYQPVSAERLVDSPSQLGANAKTFELAPDHFLDVLTQDRAEVEKFRAPIVDACKNLVQETGAIFGTRHYRQYHFLSTFSAFAAGAGLEHNESCEVGSRERGLEGVTGLQQIGLLFSHEMFHSWNGKYRRPAGLVNPDFMAPQKTELVWVYEGMTEYYGDVLACRSGFETVPAALDQIAREVDGMSEREGRSWRSVGDTAVAASILREGGPWSNDRRQQDYYPESVSTWLFVDTTIRRLTDGKKSLDDFCRLFEGGSGGVPAVAPYSYRDLVAALNKVASNDWNALFQRLVYDVQPKPLEDAFEAAGWRLVFDDHAAPDAGDDRPADHFVDLGLAISRTGDVSDMALGSPADRGGFTPGMKIKTVDGKPFSEKNLEAAIRKAKDSTDPIRFVVERETKSSSLEIDYHGGIRRPHLERIPGATDYLTQILKPRRGNG